ncbi:hypothetical protein Tco_0547523 [Tanacetum coccineum]
MRMSYMILQRRVGTLREEMKAILALCFFMTVGHNAHVEVFPNFGGSIGWYDFTNCGALVEPAPVVVEADSLAIEVDWFFEICLRRIVCNGPPLSQDKIERIRKSEKG